MDVYRALLGAMLAVLWTYSRVGVVFGTKRPCSEPPAEIETPGSSGSIDSTARLRKTCLPQWQKVGYRRAPSNVEA